jgi:hypothetical protein
MNRTIDATKKTLFKVKWKFMPLDKKYAYLWARTKKSFDQSRLAPEGYESNNVIGG